MKLALDDLAGFGGEAAFESPVLVGKPNIGDRDALFGRMAGALDRGWLSNGGPLVREFEERLADMAGVRHCVVTCNATLALQLAIKARGLSGEIIVPSLTFAATAHVVAWLGLKPVFCDVDRLTGAIDPKHAESLIGPSTTAILGVHLWGRPQVVDEILEVAQRRELAVIFDAAHALACTWKGRPVGGFGAAEVFSFHSTKFVNSFEGGAIVTNDDELAHRAASMRNFGITGQDDVRFVGVNAKMSEACAAMGLTSLESLELFRSHNATIYRRYWMCLAGIAGVRLFEFDEREQNNYQYIVIEIDESVCGVDRDTVNRLLHAENIIARRYFYPGCHMMPAYGGGVSLPNTEILASRTLALPTGMSVETTHVEEICHIIRFIVDNGPLVTRRMGQPSAALSG